LQAASPPFSDWVTTVAFYKAVHLVEAVFDHDHLGHSGDHRQRAVFLKSKPRYQMLFQNYRPLKSASEIARYLRDGGGKHYKGFDDYLGPAEVQSEILDHHLFQLERSARKLLAQ
jgi:hypothetical protein